MTFSKDGIFKKWHFQKMAFSRIDIFNRWYSQKMGFSRDGISARWCFSLPSSSSENHFPQSPSTFSCLNKVKRNYVLFWWTDWIKKTNHATCIACSEKPKFTVFSQGNKRNKNEIYSCVIKQTKRKRNSFLRHDTNETKTIFVLVLKKKQKQNSFLFQEINETKTKFVLVTLCQETNEKKRNSFLCLETNETKTKFILVSRNKGNKN